VGKYRKLYLQKDKTLEALFSISKGKMATLEELIESMDYHGIDISVVMGMGWTDFGLARETNDYIIDAVRKYPDRIVGFGSINPAWGEEAIKEIQRFASKGLKGIGEIHPHSQGFDLGDKRVLDPIVEIASENSLIFLTHSSEPVGHQYPGKGTTTPEVLIRFIQTYPDLVIVCSHWGGGLPFYTLMPEIGEALKNVYFDSAASTFLYSARIFPVVNGLLGASKILFGTDYPLLNQNRIINQIKNSNLSDDEKDSILGYNAAKLLNLVINSK